VKIKKSIPSKIGLQLTPESPNLPFSFQTDLGKYQP
jgi:hypothetical protein